jgi:transmembrane sensor
MTEPSAKLKQALAQVQAPWDDTRSEQTLRGLPRRRRAQRLRTGVATGAGTLLCLGALAWVMQAPEAQPSAARAPAVQQAPTQAASPSAAQRQLRLADGSRLALLDADTEVSVDESSERRVALHLGLGRARFEVPQQGERVFQLRTAQLVCETLGATFEVTQERASTWLRVERGRLTLTSTTPQRTLEAGEQARFEAPEGAPSASASKPESTRHKAAARSNVRTPHAETNAEVVLARETARFDATSEAAPETPPETPPETDSWRDHAERGDFKQAFPLLPSPDTMTTMSVSELMLAADAARLSGHPAAALPYLRRVVSQHAQDARAPLAAFTLGGVLMNQLGLPREAEAAYANARATSTSSALAQDALARQVEAAHRAGDEALARSLAREYLQHYPQGRRVHAVRRFGGL